MRCGVGEQDRQVIRASDTETWMPMCGRETQERYPEWLSRKQCTTGGPTGPQRSRQGGLVLEAERGTVKCVKDLSGVAVPTV
jgi:hypothetical protein